MALTAKMVRRGWALAAVALAAAAVGAGAVAWAQQAPGPTAAGVCAPRAGLLTQDDRDAIGRIFMNRVKEKIGLSDQQAEEVRIALKAMREDARGDIRALCEARLELRRLLDQQDSDPAALKAAGDQVKALQGKLLDRRLEAYVALRGKLTPDQWAKWVEFRKERAGRWMGRFRGPAMGS